MLNYRFVLTLAAALTLGWGCQVPTQEPSKSEKNHSVTLIFGAPTRTVSADWASLVDTYTVTLTSGEFATITGSTSAATPSLTLSGLRVGTWDILVQAKSLGTVVAEAQILAQSLPSATPISVRVKPLSTGTGGYSLSLKFPLSDDPIISIDAQLYTLGDAEVGLPIAIPAEDFIGPSGGLYEVVLSDAGIAAGSYRLSIALERAGSTARYLNEAVNIGGGVTSDHWVKPDGTILTSRDLVLADYASSVAILDDVTFELDGVSFPYAFDPAWFDYEADVSSTSLTQTVGFTAYRAFPGQSIAYSADLGATWTSLVSGVDSPNLTLNQGANELQVRVTAPNAVTSQIYSFALNKIILVESVDFSSPDLTLTAGGVPYVLTPSTSLVQADDSTLTFISSQTDVATVDTDGTVHPLKAGTTVITATAQDGGGASDTIAITVTGSQTTNLGLPLYTDLNVTIPVEIVVGTSTALTVGNPLLVGGTPVATWFVVLDQGAPTSSATITTATLSVDTSSWPVGQHSLDFFLSYDGVLYTKSQIITVVETPS